MLIYILKYLHIFYNIYTFAYKFEAIIQYNNTYLYIEVWKQRLFL